VAIVPILVSQNLKLSLEIERSCLMRSGFEMITAEDGEHAIGPARERRSELIPLDFDMPRTDAATPCPGLSVSRRSRWRYCDFQWGRA
jgi:CheY-like chemotaxis protein